MSVDAYKTLLGYGARSNRFSIEIEAPEEIKKAFPAGGLGSLTASSAGGAASIVLDTLQIMCHEVNFPQPRKFESFTIEYDNEIVNLAKAREPIYEQVVLKFRDKEDFEHRKFFLYWQEYIQKTGTNESKSVRPSMYKSSMKINLQSRENKSILIAGCEGIWPISVTYDTSLNYSEAKILETSITFSADKISFAGMKGSIFGIGGKPVRISPSTDTEGEKTIDSK